MIEAFLRGFRRPVAGARFVWDRPGLRGLVVAPMVLLALLLVAATAVALAVVGPWLAGLAPVSTRPDVLGDVLRCLARAWTPLAYLLALLAGGVLAVVVGRALAEPLYDRLSQRVDEEAGGTAPPAPDGLVAVVVDALRGLLHTAGGLAVVTSFSCGLLALNFVPVVGSAAEAVLSAASAAFFLAIEALDYPLSRRRVAYVDQLRWGFAHGWEALGFGAAVSLGLIVPGAIVVVLPAAVVGATLWVVEEERR